MEQELKFKKIRKFHILGLEKYHPTDATTNPSLLLEVGPMFLLIFLKSFFVHNQLSARVISTKKT